MRSSNSVVRRCVLALLAGWVLVAASTASAQSYVLTQNGWVHAAIGSGYRAFLGIPYAMPPTGNLRWRAPEPAASWAATGILEAKKFRNACAQLATGIFTQATNFSEDCLYLNVWTPDPVGWNLPVIVWMHGGAFIVGASDDYDPSPLLAKGVIVVTVNYRLGAFGFLAHPALTAENFDNSSGNYGLMDQQAALKWVKRNIAAFGGNPDNVTLAGQSAGGFSACIHLASPSSAGLFHKVITQSGPCALPFPTLKKAEAYGTKLANDLGCSSQTAACLRSKTTNEILAAIPATATFLTGVPLAPNVGGPLFPQQVLNAMLAGSYQKVPVMQGTNHDEGTLFAALAFDLLGKPLTAAQYPTVLAAMNMIGWAAEYIEQQYPLSKYVSPSAAFAAISGDAGFSCQAGAANNYLALGTRVYAYEFNDQTTPYPFPVMSFPYGVAHISELQYLFEVSAFGGPSKLNPAQKRLSDMMIGYWTRFAATGNPNSLSAPFWPSYWSQVGIINSLKTPSPQLQWVSSFNTDHKCSFWTIVGIISQLIASYSGG
jgi:para-nitrobenzyl esterase